MTGANRKGLAWVDPQCREGKTLSLDFAIAANTLICGSYVVVRSRPRAGQEPEMLRRDAK
jgi:hypothetical protein